MFKLQKSHITCIIFILLVIISKVVLDILPDEHQISEILLLRWPVITVILIIGCISLSLAHHVDFPNIWDSRVRNKQRIVLPLVVGFGFGILEVISGLILDFSNFHIPFPHSIPTYLCSGMVYEFYFHLVPVVFFTLALSWLFFKKKGSGIAFWIVAPLVSLFEPIVEIQQLTEMGLIAGALETALFFVFIFLGNLIPIIFFRKYGFLAMLLFRYTTYLVWHILWPLIYFGI